MGPGSVLLEQLFADGAIHVERSSLFDEPPPALAARDDVLGDRIEGMLLGLAIGDALGNTTEGLTPQMRAMTHGVVRDYLPSPRARHRSIGLPTDDTQLAFWTLEQLLADGRLVPERLAERFCRDRREIIGIGGTVNEFLRNHCVRGRPWHESGPRSAGNGALMRIAPVLIPHLRSPSPELWADVALASMLTHNDPASTGSCLAFVRTIWACLDMEVPPEPEWWLDTFIETLKPLEGDTAYQPRSLRERYEGSIWEYTDTAVRRAWRARLAVADACEEWLSGAYLLETLPSVLYILCRHAADPEQAMISAINDTIDNDTIGAIVGAAVGALHGRARLPERWIEGLAGRTRQHDDGRVFELVRQARERWVGAAE